MWIAPHPYSPALIGYDVASLPELIGMQKLEFRFRLFLSNQCRLSTSNTLGTNSFLSFLSQTFSGNTSNDRCLPVRLATKIVKVRPFSYMATDLLSHDATQVESFPLGWIVHFVV